jgi:hypothetical protein
MHSLMIGEQLSLCQRWRDRRHSWRHTSEGGFNPSRYDVALVPDDASVKAFVEQHHYSRSYPAAKFRAGLFERGRLVGAAVFGIPMQRKVVQLPFPHLEPYVESIELSRFVLLDQVPANAESWFLAQAFRLIGEHGVRGVVAFSDPVPRKTRFGTVLTPGHVGTIYQASNGLYSAERSTPRTLLVGPDGRVFSARAIQKIRAGERGHEYATRQLVEWGAQPPGYPADSGWIAGALVDAGVRRVRHPGNHRYLFRVGTRRDRSRTTVAFTPAPYPKKEAA